MHVHDVPAASLPPPPRSQSPPAQPMCGSDIPSSVVVVTALPALPPAASAHASSPGVLLPVAQRAAAVGPQSYEISPYKGGSDRCEMVRSFGSIFGLTLWYEIAVRRRPRSGRASQCPPGLEARRLARSCRHRFARTPTPSLATPAKRVTWRTYSAAWAATNGLSAAAAALAGGTRTL